MEKKKKNTWRWNASTEQRLGVYILKIDAAPRSSLKVTIVTSENVHFSTSSLKCSQNGANCSCSTNVSPSDRSQSLLKWFTHNNARATPKRSWAFRNPRCILGHSDFIRVRSWVEETPRWFLPSQWMERRRFKFPRDVYVEESSLQHACHTLPEIDKSFPQGSGTTNLENSDDARENHLRTPPWPSGMACTAQSFLTWWYVRQLQFYRNVINLACPSIHIYGTLT